tara:strand:+ start:4566 stop:4811 length:246 start_codon:yes stop_codon:yes gene_type:complete
MTEKRIKMPDIYDMELDARPTAQELYSNDSDKADCSHKNTTYQAREYDTNVGEGISCDDCGRELDLLDYEPDEDTLRGEDR